VPASTTTSKSPPTLQSRWLIGLMSEYRELAIQLAEQPDLLVVESDPLSGASALLALSEVDRPMVRVDARAAGDALDLAMTIATSAVTVLAPRAASWWNGTDQVDAEGLRLSRTLAQRGVDLDDLRFGSGSGLEQLRHALELAAELCAGRGLLAIDHLDDLLERLSLKASREMLGVLRADHQRADSVQQLLVGRPEGRLVSALADPTHPLFRSGSILRLRRPKPHRFVDDLAIGRPWTRVPVELIGASAELASGSPAIVWRIIDSASTTPGNGREQAVTAWHRLRNDTEPSTGQQFRLLGSVHRAAPTVVAAIALGVGPYELPLNPKTVRDALARMQARGQVFAPEKQRWAVSDPLLAAWARDHAPVWVKRRSRRGVSGGAAS
jgi:hypothetical protein